MSSHEAARWNIVAAPQALKGSLDADAVGKAIAAGVHRTLPEAEVLVIPVADGGEGTVRALVSATDGELRYATVTGPLGEQVRVEYGTLGTSRLEVTGKTAVIEMAAASGLPLVPPHLRDPRRTTTYGTGELIKTALDVGCEHILIGIGGSATNDGGAGMAQALGAHLLDGSGRELSRGGADLLRLDRIDTHELDPRLATVRISVACDVTNPLCGPSGASAIYGPQKGATPEIVDELDAALARYAEVLRRYLNADVANIPGAGAAGGLGAGLLAFTHAKLVPGAQLVLDSLNFSERIRGASLVITAEGRLDAQTAYGKAVGAVAAAAHMVGARVIALAGSVAASDEDLLALGIDVAVPLVDGPLSLEESMARAADLVQSATARTIRLLLLGNALRRPETHTL